MTQMLARFFAIIVAFQIVGTPVFAQEVTDSTGVELATPDTVVVPNPEPAFSDQAEWDALTARVKTAITQGRASNTVLGNVRSELVGWRDTFLGRQSLNSTRISTVRSQIAALGAVPESGEEDVRVAARRADLNANLRRLRAPVILATEAYTEANGLISEIDGIIRERQADRFTQRSQSPLNPTGWSQSWSMLTSAFRSITTEVSAAASSPNRRAALVDVLPAVLVLLSIAVVFVLRGRTWFVRGAKLVTDRSRRSRNVVSFLLSFGQIIIPFLGLLALSEGLVLTGMTGRRLTAILNALPMLGLFPIVAHWIAGHLLPHGLEQDSHPMQLAPDASHRAHRRFILLGYTVMLFGLAQVFVETNTFDAIPSAVVVFPFGVLMAWALYRLGHLVRRNQQLQSEDVARSFRVSMRYFLARAIMIAAILGVVFAALGYSNAFEVTTSPAAMTLYVVAVMFLLQGLSVEVYSLISNSENSAKDALIPVLIGFLLILLSLPILAVIWGAQVTDITELWARFREGFSIGETRISPTSFLLLILVFVIGYMVTRLVQSALRTTVLPRTKLDTGGQTAIVSGMGYIGIFLAAVVAITTAGIDLSGLAIVAGALSVGIGFGLQNIVSNFISGIILLIERPISQGDWIEVGGQMGIVRDISVRSTRIETFDRTDVIVPNADLISNQVTNWTRGNSVGRAIVPVGVAYGTDTDKVTAILTEIAEAHPMVLMNPPPAVLFIGFGADSLDFEIRAILRDIASGMCVKSEMNHAIAKRFVKEGIEIPFGQRDIWLRNPEALNFDTKTARKAALKDTKDKEKPN